MGTNESVTKLAHGKMNVKLWMCFQEHAVFVTLGVTAFQVDLFFSVSSFPSGKSLLHRS
jgi:hypothetical protein